MTALRRKLNSKSGAVLIIALVVFLVCAMVGSVVLTAATVNAGRLSHLRDEYQSYLTLRSSAELLRDDLETMAFTANVTTTTHSVCGLPTTSTGQNCAVSDEGQLRELVLSMAESVCQNGLEVTKTLTLDIEELETVTATVKMNRNYGITALLESDSGQMTLKMTGQQTRANVEVKTEIHTKEVYTDTWETCTKETRTEKLTVVWNAATIEKGAVQ